MEETQGLLEIISCYSRSSILSNQIDNNTLEAAPSDKKLTHEITYGEAITAIERLKKELVAKKKPRTYLDVNGKKPLKEYYKVWYKPMEVNTCT